MKSFALAAALAISAAGFAHAQTPPGDGITQQGTNPEGPACTPAGFNQGSSAYPPCQGDRHPDVAPTPPTPPPCTRELTDHCTQTYERGANR